MTNPIIGSYAYSVVMHEIGHMIGFNHMGKYNGAGAVPGSFQDSRVFSIMSYFGPSGSSSSNEVQSADWRAADGSQYAPQTPMLNDVMAIQAMYGVSTTTRTGDTVYGFDSTVGGDSATTYDFARNKTPILTIFDYSGTNTLNLSGGSTNSDIHLEAGVYSSCNSMTNNIVIAYGCTIENATGRGGNDRLSGNEVANLLIGGAGNDSLYGGAGNDTLCGWLGNDIDDGGSGIDTVRFSGNHTNHKLVKTADSFTVSSALAGEGVDTLRNIELVKIDDVTIDLTVQAPVEKARPSDVKNLREAYVGIFNHAPQTDELAYGISQTTPGESVEHIANDFFDSHSGHAATPKLDRMSKTAYIDTVFKNLTGQSQGPSANDLAVWLDAFNSGRHTLGHLVSQALRMVHQYGHNPRWGVLEDRLDSMVAMAKPPAADSGFGFAMQTQTALNGEHSAHAEPAADTYAALTVVSAQTEHLDHMSYA